VVINSMEGLASWETHREAHSRLQPGEKKKESYSSNGALATKEVTRPTSRSLMAR